MKINYNGNNSGGHFWTTAEDADKLIKAGWKPGRIGIEGFCVQFSKDFESVKDAIEEFEKITEQNVSDEGCNCCGPPHHFDWKDEDDQYDYCSGEGCLNYLFPDVTIPSSLRESLESTK